MRGWLYPLLIVLGLVAPPRQPGPIPSPFPPGGELDRIAVAVEGAESSRGADTAMWRARLSGPQGPMQVSAAAAADVGNGDRFDPQDNRRIGRAYLARLYARYGNWSDAVVAYNWGPANFERWAAGGRDAAALSASLHAYLARVMGEFLGENRPAAAAAPAPPPEPPPVDIRNPGLRRTYLADRDAVLKLRAFLDAAGGDRGAVVAVIRRVAARPGYEEFAFRPPTRKGTAPQPAALRQIAQILVDKLRAECATLVLVDRRQHPPARTP